MQIRDRIKELRRVPAGELRANARNWRTHPAGQRAALAGLLGEIGFATALVARECEDGTLELVDGHLRAETAADAIVPVLVLDVTAEEADKLLLTLDPVAALAGTDAARLAELLETTTFASAQVDELLAGLDGQVATIEGAATWEQRAEPAIPESYQVAIECADEEDQRAMFERMRGEGRRCRVLTL